MQTTCLARQSTLIPWAALWKKVPDYKLAAVKKPEMLEALVDEFLKDGYKLYGSPFCSADRYCQAIVKYGESGK